MKITVITSNKSRHNYLINLLSNICDELFVLQECETIHPGIVPGHYPVSDVMKKYFNEVNQHKKSIWRFISIKIQKILKSLLCQQVI